MTALTDEEEDAALAAEHVLGLLEPAEAVAFDRRMGVDPASATSSLPGPSTSRGSPPPSLPCRPRPPSRPR